MQSRKILVTSSLPYANGDLHLGHMVETIQTDIWVRFQKMRGNQCYYICGSDAHGTPIMIRAEKDGLTPAQLVSQVRAAHMQDYEDFLIGFDHFHTTHSPLNQEWTEKIYHRLEANGDILRQTIEQAFDPLKNMFLPDRYVKGTCPKCKATDQYGDSCEVCGATYNPMEMIDPISTLSNQPVIAKTSEHLFFNLPKHGAFLQHWLSENHTQKTIQHKLSEWFKEGLQPWDISRDAPYFGFLIPGTENKYFYVWLDAPIGYIASFADFCHQHPEIDFDAFWDKNTDTELYQFVGKDVVYFHTLFWPALLHSADLRLPTFVHAHGFLTVNGMKMSKSRGTFIKARTYLNHFKPEYLRYFFASKLNNTIEDIDIQFEDFKQKVNADLVGKLVNIASRSSGFITQHFDGMLGTSLANAALYDEFVKANVTLADYYETRQYALLTREIMRLADVANQYVNDQKPWVLIKDPAKKEEVQAICTLALNLFRLLVVYLQPILPQLSMKVAQWLNVAEFDWHDGLLPLLNHQIGVYAPLMTRIEDQQITQLNEEIGVEQKSHTQGAPVETKIATTEAKADIKSAIQIDEFAKIDLRVARIIAAESVPEADKLLKLQLDLSEEKPRQVFAGIKAAFTPESLIGKLVVCVANLEPRKMRFGMSEGMVLVAGDGKNMWLVEPDANAKPGAIVK